MGKTRIRAALRRAWQKFWGKPAARPVHWEHRLFRKDDPPWSPTMPMTTLSGLGCLGLTCGLAVDRVQLSVSDTQVVVFRTLGQRYAPAEIEKMSNYRIVGTLWLFEEAGETYARMPQ